MQKLLIGIIDTGVNPWHSHVGGDVNGCRLYVNDDGEICEDRDFRDLIGHGTAVAGVLRDALPDSSFFAVRVFENELTTYPSLLARGILRAAAEGCDVINMSLALPSAHPATTVSEACLAAREAGSVLVAAGHPGNPSLLPACLPGVHGVISDDMLDDDEVVLNGVEPYACRASGRPRKLKNTPAVANLHGHSLACARVTAYQARMARQN